VHGYAIESRIEGGEQAGDFVFAALTQQVQAPAAVFPAAPGQQQLPLPSHGALHHTAAQATGAKLPGNRL
jgi:hypothetical protein